MIGEVRSLMPAAIGVMALTATASRPLRIEVERLLGMCNNTMVITRSPDKKNILYASMEVKKNNYEDIFDRILHELQTKRTALPRMIIFCKFISDIGKLYTYFQTRMGKEFTEPPGASERIVGCRLVDMFFKGTDPTVKSEIISNFTKPCSTLRIVISTVAFGMGIDCSDVRMILHVGVPSDVETYVQEVGRAGRDQRISYAVLLYSPRLLYKCSEYMINYVRNTTICRRDELYKNFDNYTHDVNANKGCNCCDICIKKCQCGQCTDILKEFSFLSFFF